MKYVNSTLNVCYSNPFNYNEGPNSLSVYAQFIPDNPEEPDYGDFRVVVTLAKGNVEHSEVGWGNGKWGEECFADRIMRKIDEALYSMGETWGYGKDKDCVKAREYMQKALRINPDYKEACYQIGKRWCSEQCRDLLAHGCKTVHFYTMGKADNIVDILRENF